ncbi:MAG: signal peptidase I [Chloroflexi bacterium CG07_land_8_20_14_0_80_51_10]|nr:MAG: signal peptidase I [Chloroflexi bacterium CG07_land_8_20_14_0_80_51_10]
MKRALGLMLIIAIAIAGLLSLRGMMPFMPVFGTSMEPELKAGNLILIKEISPSDVKEGDIIVFNVPGPVREHYDYPPVVAHRVIRVNTDNGITFRTKGDNVAGEEPFTVRAQDLRGQVSKQIPYLGFPLLYLQSKYGTIFAIVALCLFTLFLYAEELSRGRQKVHMGIFAPVLEEQRQVSQELGQKVVGVEQAMGKFAQAMELYAQHLQSHTSAIQGLSAASQELTKSAAEQNKVLTSLGKVVEEMGTKQRAIEPMPPITKPILPVEEPMEPIEPVKEPVLVRRKVSPRWGTGLSREDWLEQRIYSARP